MDEHYAVSPPEQQVDQIVRVRDSDFTPESYDPDTGEFYRPPPARQSAKTAANLWVKRALNKPWAQK
jgi:hypothetical protein